MTTQLPDTRWMDRPAVSAVLDALEEAGGDVRFVGGCVRDCFLGRVVGEIDLCTDLEPDVVSAALQISGIRAVPTGLDHGTVTAVVGQESIEVTSLRRDVETDGRRAVVAFTKDFREDSLRRDFTMNALYADRSGAVEDFHGGISDLAAGQLRFIGDATDRIREDYLRILRFYRFHAQLGFQIADSDDRQACIALRDGLQSLSAERVATETRKLLGAHDPCPTLEAMVADGVLDHWVPEASRVDVLTRLIASEEKPNATLRLAALLSDTADPSSMSERLKLSNHERDRLASLTQKIKAPKTAHEARRLVYKLGNDTARDLALIGMAREDDDWSVLADIAGKWPAPTFLVQGRDLLASMSPGPEVGQMLSRIEERWIESDFTLTRSELLKIARNTALLSGDGET